MSIKFGARPGFPDNLATSALSDRGHEVAKRNLLGIADCRTGAGDKVRVVVIPKLQVGHAGTAATRAARHRHGMQRCCRYRTVSLL